MRIRDLEGWPPTRFQTAEAPPRLFRPRRPNSLVILSVAFIQGYGRASGGGDLLLILECRDSDTCCTARLRVQDPDTGRRVEIALTMCKGLSLIQAGRRLIPEGDRQPI